MDTSILATRTLGWLQEKGLCSQPTFATLTAQGFEKLTFIQLLAIPELLGKKDTYIHARTGSGKTLAYLLPIIERMRAMGFKKFHGVGALIVSPTRELAIQITNVLQPLADAHGFTTSAFISGQKIKSDIMEEGCTLMVGTPATLTKTLKSTNPDFIKNLKILVLDEADQLLGDCGHLEYLERIFSLLPLEKTQKILVSATVNQECIKVAQKVLKTEFSCISTEKGTSPTSKHVKQSYLIVRSHDRLSMLLAVLRTLKKKKAIVFFSTCAAVNFHQKVFQHFNLPIVACNGQLQQIKRSNRYKRFRDMERGILLTTGMADRGWDIPGVQWIIQYDPPHSPENYIHRIGRSGRGEGQIGNALLFLRPEETKYINILKKFNIEAEEIEFQGDLDDIQKQVAALVSERPDVKKLAKVAYRQYLRSYKSHEVKEVFKIGNLNISEVWQAFGFTEDPKCVNYKELD